MKTIHTDHLCLGLGFTHRSVISLQLLYENQTDLSHPGSQIKHPPCTLQSQYTYLNLQREGKGGSSGCALFVLHLQKVKGLAHGNSS